MKDPLTTNLSDFGYRELKEMRDLIDAMIEQGLPEDFHNDGVHPIMNRGSGYVFLTNEEFQVAMLNDGKLESFYSCPNCGHEGFKEECQITEDWQGCNCCKPDEKEGEVD